MGSAYISLKNLTDIIYAIDNKDIRQIENLCKNSNRNNEVDIPFEIYKHKCLTFDRTNFIVSNCNPFLHFSSPLIKKLLEDQKIILLDVIFDHLNFFDVNGINQLLLYYRNKTALSSSNLKQFMNTYKISINTKEAVSYDSPADKYLINECHKETINLTIVKYLVEHGLNVNIKSLNGETPLIGACKNGNRSIVNYLVDHGASMDKKDGQGRTPIFYACASGKMLAPVGRKRLWPIWLNIMPILMKQTILVGHRYLRPAQAETQSSLII